jgi:hypothetical protein
MRGAGPTHATGIGRFNSGAGCYLAALNRVEEWRDALTKVFQFRHGHVSIAERIETQNLSHTWLALDENTTNPAKILKMSNRTAARSGCHS